MRRTNGSRNFGQEGNRRVWGSMNHDRMRQTERLQGRSTRDGRESSYQREEDNRNSQGYSGRFEDESRWQHYDMSNENETHGEGPDYFGPRGVSDENKDWRDKGVYSTISEDDIRSELDYRSNTGGTGRTGRGSDYMDEDHRWRMAGSERNNESTNEPERSWRTNGRTGRTGRRRRITHD
jgi:hypothetical protein